MRRRRSKRLPIIIIMIFVMFFTLSFLRNTTVEESSAATGFNAGYIVSDYVMGNYTSMTVDEIQAFLNSKNSCNKSLVEYPGGYLEGEYYYRTFDSGRTYVWHVRDNTFVCMAQERFSDGGVVGTGETAAQIIYNYAQEYRINPQIILVLLEKEQGLLSDRYPNNFDYGWALGFGAYDYGEWDTKYAGFKEQIKSAYSFYSWFLYEYTEDEAWWSHDPSQSEIYARLGQSNILYNPDWDCGYSSVNIQNAATLSLYVYTPYQPNEAALAAGSGTGDYCSSYGNRNFYNYYISFFGDITDENKKIYIPETVKGTYYLVSALAQDKVIGIEGEDNGSNIALQAMNNTVEQTWKLQGSEETGYVIINGKTNKTLDVAGGNTNNGTNIQQYEQNNTCAQIWKLQKEGEYYILKSSCNNNSVVDVAGGNSNHGTNIQLYESNHTNAQKWILKSVSNNNEESVNDDNKTITEDENKNDKYYLVSALAQDKVIGIEGEDNGSNIALQAMNNTVEQTWKLQGSEETGYVIINGKTNKTLDVAGGNTNNGTNIQQYEQNNTCAQIWKLQKEGEYYILKSSCNNNSVVDVAGGNSNHGTNIQLYESNHTNAQKWILKSVSNNNEESVNDDNKTITEDENKNDKYYLVSALAQDKVIGIEGEDNGSNIALQAMNNTVEQTWKLQGSEETGYVIINGKTNKTLDVAGGNTNNGTNIQQYEQNNTCAQIWKLQKEGEYYILKSSCNNNSVVDVAGGNSNHGTNIQLYESNHTNAQKWILKKAD